MLIYKNQPKWLCLTATLTTLIFWHCTQMSDYCSEGNKYNPGTQFCGTDGLAYPLCNGFDYDPSTHGCLEGAILPRCGQNLFHPNDEFCDANRIYKKCNGATFNPETFSDCNGEPINPVCNNEKFHPDVDFCFNNELYPKCGGVNGYDPGTEFCYDDNRIYKKCDGRDYYDPLTYTCKSAVDWRPVCGEIHYDETVYFCRNDKLYEYCGTMVYNPPEEVCRSRLVDIAPIVPPDDTTYTLTVIVNPVGAGVVTRSPDKDSYNIGERVTLTVAADEEAGYVFAGWSGASLIFSNPSVMTITISMSKDMVLTADFRNFLFTDSRDGQIYKTVEIGEQTWMAENLNYETANSQCYGNDPENCATYGRLYSWNEAMNACPAGWHLPSLDEWNTLIVFAGGSNMAGTALKAGPPDWDGEDALGFSALPGGEFAVGGIDIGSGGTWWTATDYYSDDAAYYLGVLSDYAHVYINYDVSGLGHSVRCVQN
jgi:uncharacterized protein (TIGR02145 family)/uncharacterized repeat protein (TIGR02543 family)